MAQPPADHACVKTTKPKAAAAARIGAALARRKRAELLELLRPCFARTEPWLQAGRYAAAVMSQIPRRNGWTIAAHAGDRTPDKTQRLLSRAVWDAFAAMRVVRRFAVAGLDEAAGKTGWRRGLAVGAIDETGQVKAGKLTAGVKRQYLGCVGKVANGINTVHLAYVREGTGHALIGAREWIPAAQIGDPATSVVMGLPEGLVFRTKGQLAIDILTEAFADGVRLDFVCGDETSDAVKLSSRSARLFGGGGEGDVLVVVLPGVQAFVQAAEEAAEQVALGGGVPVADVAAPVVVGAGAG
jgi:DDE superfamily endonuclease